MKVRATADISTNDLIEVITEMKPYEISDFILQMTNGLSSTSIRIIIDRLDKQQIRKENGL